MDIQKLQSYENGSLGHYDRLSDSLKSNDYRTTHASFNYILWPSALLGIYPSVDNFFSRHIGKKPLVDLGCGKDWHFMYRIGAGWGASAYLGIDLYNVDDADRDIVESSLKSQDIEHACIDSHLVRADMLGFVARMPQGRQNFTINMIDDCIVKNPDYYRALSVELARAMAPGCVVFGFYPKDNKGLFDYLETDALEEVDLPKIWFSGQSVWPHKTTRMFRRR